MFSDEITGLALEGGVGALDEGVDFQPHLPDRQPSERDLIPASIHHEYDFSLGHWSRQPNF
jgi:hypothetical protein